MTFTTDTAARPRRLPLDLARGVAALLVALYHFQDIGWFRFRNTAPLPAVPFFFILSGFVLSYAYGTLIRTRRMSPAAFAWSRIARLYPLHLATLLVLALLHFAAGGPSAPRVLRPELFDRTALVEGLTLTHALLGGGQGFNLPSWTIAIEL